MWPARCKDGKFQAVARGNAAVAAVVDGLPDKEAVRCLSGSSRAVSVCNDAGILIVQESGRLRQVQPERCAAEKGTAALSPPQRSEPHADCTRYPSHPPVHTLTRIYSIEYTKDMELVFKILAEQNCRAILRFLVLSQVRVGEIGRQRCLPQPTVVKRLRKTGIA